MVMIHLKLQSVYYMALWYYDINEDWWTVFFQRLHWVQEVGGVPSCLTVYLHLPLLNDPFLLNICSTLPTQISVLMAAVMPVLTHTCTNISTHTYTACNITIIHRSPGTLYPLQTTLHNKWTFSDCWPFLFAPSFSLLFTVWCSLMDANGHLLNWISSQDGDKRGTALFFSPSVCYFELCSVQRCVERTLMRRSEETLPLLDSLKTLCSRLALTPTQ